MDPEPPLQGLRRTLEPLYAARYYVEADIPAPKGAGLRASSKNLWVVNGRLCRTYS
jgi:hypothetical protein